MQGAKGGVARASRALSPDRAPSVARRSRPALTRLSRSLILKPLTMDILLFDLDGVLLNSAGYHRSLVETVRQVSRALGFGDRGLAADEIEAFEVRDITAEWDSSAIVTALLLVEAWRTDPERDLPRRPPLQALPMQHAFPDVRAFLTESDRVADSDPVRRARSALMQRLDGAPPSQVAALLSTLEASRSLNESLTFWLLQLFNLGSRRFEAVYGLPPGLETPSYLETYDRPTLNPAETDALTAWITRGDRGAAIVTNRPSTSPMGVFNSPEAEIGVQVSWFGHLPVVAAGDLGWRATSRGLDPQAFLKPSPVHMLAGLLRAMGQDSGSVETAIRLAHLGEFDAVWKELRDARVWLFEDAPKGHTAARLAAQLLAGHGIRLDLTLFGIGTGSERARALEAAGACVVPDLGTALDAAIPGWRL